MAPATSALGTISPLPPPTRPCIMRKQRPPQILRSISGLMTWVHSRLPGRGLVVGRPMLWLVVFFLMPFLIVVKISFAESDATIPPYRPLFNAGRRHRAADKAESG